MTAPTAAEPMASADIQAQHDALTAKIESYHAEHAEATAAFSNAPSIEAKVEARGRRGTLEELIAEVEAERDALEEPLSRAKEREYHERCERNREAAQEQGGEKIAELDAAVCEFARKVAPILEEISQAEERAYQAAYGLNRYATRGNHLNRHWQRYGDGGFLFNATQMALEHLKRAEHRS